MVHNDNAEWEQFSALLDDVVPDTSDAAQHSQSDAYHDSQTDAQAQDELQSSYTDEDDSDLEEVEVDQFAMKPEMEAEAGTTELHYNSTYEAIATGPVVAEEPVELSSSSSSTATTRSAEPQSEAAANRARATRKGYLARRRAARKSASLQTAKTEAASQAGSMTPQAPSIVATSPATLPPPPPLPVGAAGRRQLWEETLRLGLPRVKAEYRVTLPPARPASAPVIGVTSAGPVPSVAARHQSAPVASTSRGKRSREQEDRGDEVVQKRPKVNNAQSRKRTKASAPSPSGGTHRPQWTPYAVSQAEPSRLHGFAPAAQPNAARHQEQEMQHRPEQQTAHLAQPRRAGPSTEVPATYTMPPQSAIQRPLQIRLGPRHSHHLDGPTSTQMHATPGRTSGPVSLPSTFSRAVLSAAASVGTRNRTYSEVHGNATGPQQRQPETPQAGPSRAAYEQPYIRAGVQHPYDQPVSAQSYMMPVPSGWNDPAAVPRTFARTQTSASTGQMDNHVTHRQIHDAPVAYAAQPQQQMERPALSMYGGGGEQLTSVDAPGSLPVYNQPYAPPMPTPAGWSSSAQMQAMSGSERVPAYLTIYAPPNHPPGWNPQGQAPVYEQEPSARRQGSMSSAYGYGYDF